MNGEEKLAALGVRVPEVLLPSPDVPPEKFAVIACDQHSAEPEYWAETEKIVGDSPSALRMILPEAWLGRKDKGGEAIFACMDRYLSDGTLQSAGKGFVYVRRQTETGVRKGLVAALDLDDYDYTPGSRSLIRATEATVQERLPARVAIRRRAALEMPHVLVLIDDAENRLMGALERRRDTLKKLYDFDLMQSGGRIEGYQAADPEIYRELADVLEGLKEQSGDGFLFAVGDGNHSLAAAKACWEELKPQVPEAQRQNHPMRYALAEIVNLYDEGLSFHPIHRLLYRVDPEQVQREVGFSAKDPPSLQVLQPKLDAWLKNHPEAELEYIHGREECLRLGGAPDRLPIVFSPFPRGAFFRTVQENGIFVRKSFSLGTAREKRYYLECRRIH